MLSPNFCRECDEAVSDLLTPLPSSSPALVVVSSLERLLFNYIGGRQDAESIAKAGRIAHTILRKYRALCQDSGGTLLFLHCPHR